MIVHPHDVGVLIALVLFESSERYIASAIDVGIHLGSIGMRRIVTKLTGSWLAAGADLRWQLLFRLRCVCM